MQTPVLGFHICLSVWSLDMLGFSRSFQRMGASILTTYFEKSKQVPLFCQLERLMLIGKARYLQCCCWLWIELMIAHRLFKCFCTVIQTTFDHTVPNWSIDSGFSTSTFCNFEAFHWFGIHWKMCHHQLAALESNWKTNVPESFVPLDHQPG